MSRPAAFPWPEQPVWKDDNEDDAPELSEANPTGISHLIPVCFCANLAIIQKGKPLPA